MGRGKYYLFFVLVFSAIYEPTYCLFYLLVMFGMGRGSMVAICVNFDNRQVFVMFTLAVVDNFVEDNIPILVLMDFMAFPNLYLICQGFHSGRFEEV